MKHLKDIIKDKGAAVEEKVIREGVIAKKMPQSLRNKVVYGLPKSSQAGNIHKEALPRMNTDRLLSVISSRKETIPLHGVEKPRHFAGLNPYTHYIPATKVKISN